MSAVTTNTPLLTYGVSSAPNPIQASSSAGNPALATLTIVASNNTTKLITIESLAFSFLVGKNAKDFASGSAGITISPPNGWSFGAPDGTAYTAKPNTAEAGKIGRTGLSFEIANVPVNDQVGVAALTISEVSGESSAPRTAATQVPLAKFPVGFTVDALQALPLNVVAGGSTTLSWSGSPSATYMIQYGDRTIRHPNEQPNEPLAAVGSYTVTGIQQTTTFTLIATANVAGQPRSVERQITVTATDQSPQIDAFVALPAKAHIGGKVKLRWNTKFVNAAELWSSNAVGPVAVDVNSTGYEVAPILPTDYTLVATGADPNQAAIAQTSVGSTYGPGWNVAAQYAPWPVMPRPILTSLGGRLWTIDTSAQTVYSSTGGNNWSAVTTTAPWSARAGSAGLAFGGRLWVMGGWEIRSQTPMDDIWSSPDGIQWTQVSPASQTWSPRSGHMALVHNDAIWLIGGATWNAGWPDASGLTNDVWKSTDGASWAQVGRVGSVGVYAPAVASFGTQMWVLGGFGQGNDGIPAANTNVYSSSDGKVWAQSPGPPWSARFGVASAILDDELWLIGGASGTGNQFVAHNEAWSMSNATIPVWTRSADPPPLSTDQHTGLIGLNSLVATTYGNALWLAGGVAASGGSSFYSYVPEPPYPAPLK